VLHLGSWVTLALSAAPLSFKGAGFSSLRFCFCRRLLKRPPSQAGGRLLALLFLLGVGPSDSSKTAVSRRARFQSCRMYLHCITALAAEGRFPPFSRTFRSDIQPTCVGDIILRTSDEDVRRIPTQTSSLNSTYSSAPPIASPTPATETQMPPRYANPRPSHSSSPD
jgi:hypothetical protein